MELTVLVIVLFEGWSMGKRGGEERGEKMINYWLGYHFVIFVSLIIYMGREDALNEIGGILRLNSIIEGDLWPYVRGIAHCLGASMASLIYNIKEKEGLIRRGIDFIKHLIFNVVMVELTMIIALDIGKGYGVEKWSWE